MCNRLGLSTLIVCMFLLVLTCNIHAESTVNIVVDGEAVEFTEQSGFPFVEEGTSYVPLRVVLEAFGAKVTWNDEKGMVEATKGDITMGIPIGEAYIIKNDETIELEKRARLVNKRSYLPIRRVMESLGCKVSWDGETESVKIESEEYKEAIREFEDVIIFENDIRLFTLYAFMNFTGYDDENNSEGFHEVRKMVRDDLDMMGLELKDNNFYTNSSQPYWRFGKTLHLIKGPPNFTPIEQIKGKYLVHNLDLHLKEFYDKANVGELYEKYQPYYEKELSKYSANVYLALYKMNKFLKVDTPTDSFYITVNLLDAYWRGSGLGSVDEVKQVPVIVTGPSDEPNILNIVHEYLHGVINPIINDMELEVDLSKYLFKDIQDSNAVAKQDYNTWNEIVIESIIRALDNKIAKYENEEIYIKVQSTDGFILTNYFYNVFTYEYPQYEASLEEFIKEKLIELEGVQVEDLLKEVNS